MILVNQLFDWKEKQLRTVYHSALHTLADTDDDENSFKLWLNSSEEPRNVKEELIVALLVRLAIEVGSGTALHGKVILEPLTLEDRSCRWAGLKHEKNIKKLSGIQCEYYQLALADWSDLLYLLPLLGRTATAERSPLQKDQHQLQIKPVPNFSQKSKPKQKNINQ